MQSKLQTLWESRNLGFLFVSIWSTSLLLLPITSFPFLVSISGADTIAPPSGALMAVLFILWLVPYIIFKRIVPLEIGPFLVFLAVVMVSWGMSLFLPIPPYRDHTILSEFRGDFFTLVIAAVVFLTAAVWVAAEPGRLRLTLQFISLGGILLIVWSLVQAYFVLFKDGFYPRFVVQMQTLVSSRNGSLLFPDRLTGMAFEPSWFAHQLVLVYIPLWLSATITGYSAFSKRIFRFSVENILLIFGLVVLFLSFSRIGWFSFLLMGVYAAIYFNLKIIRLIKAQLRERYKGPRIKIYDIVTTVTVLLLFLFGYVGIVGFLFFLGAKFEPRFASILATDFSTTTGIIDLTNRLFFAERAVYWSAGLDVFNRFPLFGVGLGNSGFFFPETMPSFGYALTEIQDLFFRFTFVPNSKSMWVRLLAETGIVGFSIFISWLVMIFQSSRLTGKFGSPELRVVGWLGQFAIVAYIAEGFSVDSFAMPYIWLTLGLASAAAALTRAKVKYSLNSPVKG